MRRGVTGAPPPPTLDGWPLLGSLPEFLRDPFQIFVRGRQMHGSIFTVRFPGQRLLVATGAEGLRFLAKHERDLLRVDGIWSEFVELFGGRKALVNVDGDPHAEMRKRLRPTMSRSTFENRIDLVSDVVDARLRRWDGQVVPVERFTRDLVFHQLAALMDMRGGDPDALYDDLLRVMHTGLETLVAKRRPRIVLHLPAFRRSLRKVKEMAVELYASVASDAPEEGLFPVLHAFVREGILAPDDVPLVALTPYFAGIDTVGAVFSFMLAEVLRRPELRAALIDEANAASAAEPLGRAWLARLPLAEAVELETHRFHPTMIGHMREAREPFEYAGYQVARGDLLLVSVGAQGLTDEYFADPGVFDPYRFLGQDAVHPEPGALNPFGMGPHSCLGAAMADVQLIASLALLLQRAEIELEHPERPLATGYQPYPLPKGDRLRIRLRS